MALVVCKNCGKNISDKAEQCPHCGCLLTEKPPINGNIRIKATQGKSHTQNKGSILTTALVILIICPIISFLIFYFIFGNGSNFEGGSSDYTPLNFMGVIYTYGIIVPISLTLLLYCIGFITLKASNSK